MKPIRYIAGFALALAVLGVAGTASAWNPPTVAGEASCITNQDGGVTDWSITWTATNHENSPFTTKITNPAGYAPASYLPSVNGQTFTRSETNPISTTSDSEQVTQKWYLFPTTPVIVLDTRTSNTATVDLPEGCHATPVSANVSFQDPDCDNQNTAAVIGAEDTAGIDFTVTGNVEPGGYVTVTAEANKGFTFGDGVHEWSHEFGYIEDCRTVVTPVEPTLTVNEACGVTDSYTIPAVEGIIYSIDGTPVAAGTYPLGAGEEVTITAEPADGYKFDTEVWVDETTEYSWTFTGSEVPVCTTLVTPIAPTITVNTVCGVLDTYTVFSAEGVVYSVAAGNYPLAAGVSVTITATPAAGHTFTAGAVTSWTFVGSEVQACAVDEPPVPEVQGALPVTGGETSGLLAAAALAVIAGTTAVVVARRRRPRPQGG